MNSLNSAKSSTHFQLNFKRLFVVLLASKKRFWHPCREQESLSSGGRIFEPLQSRNVAKRGVYCDLLGRGLWL